MLRRKADSSGGGNSTDGQITLTINGEKKSFGMEPWNGYIEGLSTGPCEQYFKDAPKELREVHESVLELLRSVVPTSAAH